METILLAAGLSKRMGAQKLLLPFADSDVISTVIKNIYNTGFTPIHTVVSKDIAAFIKPQDWLHVSVNPAPERGQAGSFAIGLSMLSDGSDFCVMLADQPLAKADEICALAVKFSEMPADKTVLVPQRGEKLGHPMFYRAQWKTRFAGSQGDGGDKKVLFSYEDEMYFTDAPDSFFCDLDTPADYQNILKAN